MVYVALEQDGRHSARLADDEPAAAALAPAHASVARLVGPRLAWAHDRAPFHRAMLPISSAERAAFIVVGNACLPGGVNSDLLQLGVMWVGDHVGDTPTRTIE